MEPGCSSDDEPYGTDDKPLLGRRQLQAATTKPRTPGSPGSAGLRCVPGPPQRQLLIDVYRATRSGVGEDIGQEGSSFRHIPKIVRAFLFGM